MAPGVPGAGVPPCGAASGRGRVSEPCVRAERLFDPERLVPPGHAHGAGERSDLERAHRPGQGQVDDGQVLGLA
jgi:hypothetical protein